MTTSEAELKRRFDSLTSHGWLTWGEAKLLQQCLDETQGPIIEVGSYFGRSAMLMAHTGRNLTCIDPWDDDFSSDYSGEDIFLGFLKNMGSVKGARYRVIRKRVEEVDPFPADLVYLDGDHSYNGTLSQVRFAVGCNPSIIAIHDVNNDGGGLEVKKAALSILRMWDERVGRLAVWGLK